MALCDYESKDGVAILTLNDPPANAYSHDMFRQIDAAIIEARFDEKVHVVVITGKGEKFFCAGANIDLLAKATPYWKYNFCLHANETLNRLEHTPKLVIAAINGHCVGGGLEIALAADLRIARKSAGLLGLPEVALGVLPGTGGTQRLARLLGKSRSIEMMVEGRRMKPDDALAIGLVNKVFDDEGFLEKAMEYAKSFCPPAKAPLAVGRIKRAVQSGLEMSFEQGLALERELQAELFASEDAKEGFVAFVEKRAPAFRAK